MIVLNAIHEDLYRNIFSNHSILLPLVRTVRKMDCVFSLRANFIPQDRLSRYGDLSTVFLDIPQLYIRIYPRSTSPKFAVINLAMNRKILVEQSTTSATFVRNLLLVDRLLLAFLLLPSLSFFLQMQEYVVTKQQQKKKKREKLVNDIIISLPRSSKTSYDTRFIILHRCR